MRYMYSHPMRRGHKTLSYLYVSGNKYYIKIQGVLVKRYAPGGNKVQKAVFSFKVKVKVTRSLILVSFERASLVKDACQI